MMKRRPLTPSALRLIFSVSLFLIAILGFVAFSLTDRNLQGVATAVNHTVIDANASQSNLQMLQKIQTELADQKDVVDRTSSIVAESKSYQYQDQIIKDLNDYATKSNITITNIDFSAAAPAGTGAAAGAGADKKAATETAPGINGVKSTSVSITLKNPVIFNSMLHFIKSIEQNLTKMQLSKISLSKDPVSGGVSSGALTLEVYVR